MIIWNTPTGLAVTRVAVGENAESIASQLQQQTGWTLLHIGELQLPQEARNFDEVSFDTSSQSLVLDLIKIRELVKNKLRRERGPLLADLDVQYMRAQEQGAPTTEIVAEKQRLRDITSQVDALNTVAELRAITCQR